MDRRRGYLHGASTVSLSDRYAKYNRSALRNEHARSNRPTCSRRLTITNPLSHNPGYGPVLEQVRELINLHPIAWSLPFHDYCIFEIV